jgi:gluconokinase
LDINDLILAVDIGTSAAKAVLFDADAKQVAIARKHYPIQAPHKGWSEQEPDVVFNGVLAALREITGSLPEGDRIVGVSFSSQLYSILAVNAEGKALTNSLTWSDTRSAQFAHAIRQQPEAPGVYQRTGCPIDSIYPLSKIGWLKENADLAGDARFISIKEYVIFRLTGRLMVDWSIASATGLFNVGTYGWDGTALSLLDITPDNLSKLVSPKHVVTEWNKDVLDFTGLLAGTPLVIGGGDGPLASIGVGAYDADVLAVNVGTSAAARCVISEARVDPDGRLWTYVVDEGLWVIGGIVSSGGIVYEWFLKNLLSGPETTGGSASIDQAHDYVERMAAAVPAGAENLIFLPYLGGEQCPAWHPHTRGSFFGLDFRHGKGHLARAALEGITRSIYRVAQSIQSLLEGQFAEVRVTGGLSTSPLWLQIAADMFGLPVGVPESAEGSARGAALLAMVALGRRSNLQDFDDQASVHRRVYPRKEAHAYYERQYQTFRDLLECARSLQRNREV